MHSTCIKITICRSDDALQDYIHKVPVLPALHSSYVHHVIATGACSTVLNTMLYAYDL